MTADPLAGRVAIVTGAAGGFGRVLVRALLDHGAKVAAFDIDERGLSALSDAHARDMDRLLVESIDIGEYAACERGIAATLERLGGLHILINNGAIGMNAIRTDCMQNMVGIQEITPQVWQRFVLPPCPHTMPRDLQSGHVCRGLLREEPVCNAAVQRPTERRGH